MNPLGLPLLLALSLPPPAPAGPPNDPRPRDLELAVRARRVLAEDHELGPLNVGVRVRDGVATLWGPVPDAAAEQRALRLVGQVTGVRDARSDLYVAGGDAGGPVPVLVGHAPRRPADEADPLLGLTVPLVSRTKPFVPAEPPAAVAVTLYAPVPLGAGTAVAASAKVGGSEGTLAERVEKVRAGDPRFRGVGVEVRDATVVLRGSVGRGQNVMAFAQALSRLDGVERVVVRNEPAPR